MKNNIYITGASGVIGSELAAHFSQIPDYGTIAVSRRPCPTLPADHPSQKTVNTVFDADWLDANDSDATILHCAGLANPRIDFRNFAVLAQEHILPHIEMVETMLTKGWRGRLVFFSSGGAVYGNPLEMPIKETHPTSPLGLYGLHKLCLERALIQLAEERGFELVILRVSNPYGTMVSKPGQGVIPILINAFLNDQPFTIIGDGSAERDYIELSDLCAAVESVTNVAMSDPALVLNIGSGQRTSLNEIIRLLGGLLGSDLKTSFVASQNEVHSNVLCCDLARDLLGWQAKVSLQDGLKAMLKRHGATK